MGNVFFYLKNFFFIAKDLKMTEALLKKNNREVLR
jgi:hypothetical protein